MGKYAPLKEFLLKQGAELVPMTFAEIEAVLDAALPASKRYPAWWSNNEFNNTMTSEWLAAGYQTEAVDVSAERLVFRKSAAPRTGKGQLAKKAVPPQANSDQHPMFGCLKGLLTISPGVDLTAPTGEEWGNPYIGDERLEVKA
jgi:hypothetical protein